MLCDLHCRIRFWNRNFQSDTDTRKTEINKLRKSWAKAKKEHFKPFIYKHSVDGKISYDSLYVLHPVYANLTFRSRKYSKIEDFLPAVTEQKAWDFENINYKYNTSLSLFTVYATLSYFYDLVIGQFKYYN